jgi:hypothetical protein
MEVANTLADYDAATITAAERFIVTAPGACIIKLTTAVIYGFRNKLECLLSLESLSCLV